MQIISHVIDIKHHNGRPDAHTMSHKLPHMFLFMHAQRGDTSRLCI